MTYNEFGGTLSLTRPINQSVKNRPILMIFWCVKSGENFTSIAGTFAESRAVIDGSGVRKCRGRVSSFLTAHQHISYFSALQWCEYCDKIVEI